MSFVQLFGFLYLLLGDHRPTQKALQDVLQTKEHSGRELAAPALEVGIDHRRVVRVLVVMGHLKHERRETHKLTENGQSHHCMGLHQHGGATRFFSATQSQVKPVQSCFFVASPMQLVRSSKFKVQNYLHSWWDQASSKCKTTCTVLISSKFKTTCLADEVKRVKSLKLPAWPMRSSKFSNFVTYYLPRWCQAAQSLQLSAQLVRSSEFKVQNYLHSWWGQVNWTFKLPAQLARSSKFKL